MSRRNGRVPSVRSSDVPFPPTTKLKRVKADILFDKRAFA